MNYFELFDIETHLFPDKDELKSRFYDLSRKYHPDINQSSDPEAYINVLEMSGKVNAAYKTLSDDLARLRYLLEIYHVALEANEALPPAFLMEMMDLNEAVMEAAADPQRKADAIKEIADRKAALWAQARVHWSNKADGPPSNEVLSGLKNIYIQLKYLLRISKNLDSFAAP